MKSETLNSSFNGQILQYLENIADNINLHYLEVIRDGLVHDTDAADVAAVDVNLLRHRLKRE